MMPLPPAQVHLWGCRADPGMAAAAERRGILSAEERARADRFHDAKARNAFVAARSWLRRVLALYIPVAPSHLRFAETAFGRPFLVSDAGSRAIDFNLSHSGELVIVAVAAGMPVGVDIERIRPVPTDLLAGCLAPRELAMLSALAPGLREESFIRCWTRKEACLKAIGVGLNGSPSSFEVSLDPFRARLLAVESDPAEADLWQLADLAPMPGYCGTLAARRRGWTPVWMARP